MARVACKRIHYFRAVFPEGARPGHQLQSHLGRVFTARPNVADTQVQTATYGLIEVRNRTLPTGGGILLSIGAGAPGESMSTMGIGVRAAQDTDLDQPPPRGRAFKLRDCYCLLRRNELLILTDGIRVEGLRYYLRQLLQMGNRAPEVCAFDLRPVEDADRVAVLEREGVKEVRLNGVLNQATVELNDAEGPRGLFRRITGDWMHLFEREAESEEERQALAERYAEIQVTSVIKVRRGKRGEPLVLNAVEEVGRELLEEAPPSVGVQLVTTEGNRINVNEVHIGTDVRLNRNTDRNDLNHVQVYEKLLEYADTLRQRGLWGA